MEQCGSSATINFEITMSSFYCHLEYQEHLKAEFIKLEYRWRDIDPKVVANIPVVPINFNPHRSGLPDRIDWLSPFWDTCLNSRMTE